VKQRAIEQDDGGPRGVERAGRGHRWHTAHFDVVAGAARGDVRNRSPERRYEEWFQIAIRCSGALIRRRTLRP
jgi:hypothetical protein